MIRPFVKWAGGKTQLLSKLSSNLPQFNRYYEPFVGGGALFFHLQPQIATLGDVNKSLITTYQVIKNNVYELVEKLKSFKNEEEFYYKIRAEEFSDDVSIAARFIYLNKCCFNGLYRENSKGQFNVPFGKRKNPNICDEKSLIFISKFLSSRKDLLILNEGYDRICEHISIGDLVYFDPPYYPLKENLSFTRYNKNDFTKADQIKLSKLAKKLSDLGAYVILSNSNCEAVKELYKDFNIEEVEVFRFINSNGLNRKKDKIEVIIRNF